MAICTFTEGLPPSSPSGSVRLSWFVWFGLQRCFSTQGQYCDGSQAVRKHASWWNLPRQGCAVPALTIRVFNKALQRDDTIIDPVTFRLPGRLNRPDTVETWKWQGAPSVLCHTALPHRGVGYWYPKELYWGRSPASKDDRGFLPMDAIETRMDCWIRGYR